MLDGPGVARFEPSSGPTVHQRLTEAEVHFSDEGSGSPVLLLHGFPTTRMLWKRVSPLLAAAGFRAIAPDLVGYGASEAAENVPIDATNQARWQLELLDALHFSAETVVVAHDIGTAVAQLMVARAPARIKRLILIDGVYADRWAMEAVESICEWDPSRTSALSRVLARRSRSWTKSPATVEALGEMLAAFDGERGGRRLIRAAKSLDPRQTAAVLEQLRREHPPSLILWGDDDAFLSVDEVARPLAELLNAELKVLPGGHFLPIDAPDRVAEEVLRFARSSKPP